MAINEQDFAELAGRIEGLERAYVILAGMLQQQGQLDIQRLQANLRIHSEGTYRPGRETHSSVRTQLELLADNLLREQLRQRGKSSQEIETILQGLDDQS